MADRQSARRGATRPPRKSVVPPQHGAWAFVGLPVVLGTTFAPWTPLLLVAAVGWVLAYPLSYFTIAVLRYPRPERFRKAWLTWLAAAAPFGVVMVISRPWLVFVGLFFAVALALNLVFARRRDERSVSNDSIFILECVAIVPVSWGIGAIPSGWSPAAINQAPASVWWASIACLIVLIDSTLHVKSLIRERNNPRYRLGSRAWSIAGLLVALAIALSTGAPRGLLLLIPFVFLLVRAFAVSDPKMKPSRIGLLELPGFVLLAIAAPLALA
ncbi:MAG: YwiC-like family protein [Candidatus Nanopelagicales bacterium]|nr:YwiC-like family protein [Candidatus Nanopelagicales bacterium]